MVTSEIDEGSLVKHLNPDLGHTMEILQYSLAPERDSGKSAEE